MHKHLIARAMAGARWNPRDGLIGGDQGIWLDPSDLSTMYVESGASPATLTPATLNGPVGRILDKSGRGNHAYSPTDAARPTLRIDANGCYYLLFNGSNQYLKTSGSFLSNISRFIAVTGYEITVSKSLSPVFSCGINGQYSSDILQAQISNGKFLYQVNNGSDGNATDSIASVVPYKGVTSFLFDGTIATAENRISIRKNNTQSTLTFDYSAPALTATNPTAEIFIGTYINTFDFLNGKIYQVVICANSSKLNIDQITRTEEFVNRKTKAY